MASDRTDNEPNTEGDPSSARIGGTSGRPIGHILFVLLLLIAGACAINATDLLGRADASYVSGLRNGPPPFILTPEEFWWLGGWAASLLLLAICSITGARAIRAFARGVLAACVAATFLSCQSRAMPIARYESGLRIWAARHVYPIPIRGWIASLPPTSTAKTVAPAQWPAAIVAIGPDTVTQLANGQGVLLQWGHVATWGNARRVVVLSSGMLAPPHDDLLFLWTEVHPGVYVSYQYTD